jgi:hypothetical protein
LPPFRLTCRVAIFPPSRFERRWLCAHVLGSRSEKNYKNSIALRPMVLHFSSSLATPTYSTLVWLHPLWLPHSPNEKSCFSATTASVLCVCLSRVILLEFAARLHQRVLLCVSVCALKKKITKFGEETARARDHNTHWEPLHTHRHTRRRSPSKRKASWIESLSSLGLSWNSQRRFVRLLTKENHEKVELLQRLRFLFFSKVERRGTSVLIHKQIVDALTRSSFVFLCFIITNRVVFWHYLRLDVCFGLNPYCFFLSFFFFYRGVRIWVIL